ncbi:MAG: LacI family DNA-binding transcriptional regulator [Specibacter sp.]
MTTPRPLPTMRDVAAHAGVSPMTVSRTLRGDPKVSPELRERVLASVAALSYRTNDAARSLKAGRANGLIGLAVTNLANPFYSELALGVESEAAEHGYRVLLGNTGEDVGREKLLVEDFASRRVQGIVVAPATTNHDHLDPARLNGMPVVLATSPPLGPGIDSVTLDDFGATREAVLSLIEEGHRRIGFLGLPEPLWTGRERLRGYRAALVESGIPDDPALYSGAMGSVTTLEELATLADGPTAVFASNNRHTLAACRFVHEHGKSLRIFGFDDVPSADLFPMPLSVITYSPAELGRVAARLLIDRITDAAPQPPRRLTVQTHLKSYGMASGT